MNMASNSQWPFFQNRVVSCDPSTKSNLHVLPSWSTTLLIYDLQSEDWINTYYMLKGFLKACRPPKVSNEMKCTNEKMKWNTEDTNLSIYVSNADVDRTINSGQGTGINTLNHSATTPHLTCSWLRITTRSDSHASRNSGLAYCVSPPIRCILAIMLLSDLEKLISRFFRGWNSISPGFVMGCVWRKVGGGGLSQKSQFVQQISYS